MKRLIQTVIALGLCLMMAGCSTQTTVQVAATTMPVYFFASQICEGTPITVARLITEEVSCVHDYTLTVSQMKAIEQAEMVIISGAGLEDFMEDALLKANLVVDCSEHIPLLEGSCSHSHEEEDAHGHEEGHAHENDPHYWLDPDNASHMVEHIVQALSAAYPEYSGILQDNADRLFQQLAEFKEQAKAELSELSSREIITFHDGFGYLAHAFDLEILEAIEEESGSEPSAQELIGLIELVEHHNVAAIFTETNGSSSAAGIISAEIGVPVYTLDMAMSGESWFEAMQHNIDTLKEALG